MEAPSGDELQLSNRLAESRSPYVGSPRVLIAHMEFILRPGPRPYEQSRRVADVGPRSSRLGQELQPSSLSQHRICRLPLYENTTILHVSPGQRQD